MPFIFLLKPTNPFRVIATLKKRRSSTTTPQPPQYAKDTKPLDLVPFVVEQANTRGSAQVRKSNISAAVTPDNHPKACGNGKQFGINFHNGKQYEWKLFECQSAEVRPSPFPPVLVSFLFLSDSLSREW